MIQIKPDRNAHHPTGTWVRNASFVDTGAFSGSVHEISSCSPALAVLEDGPYSSLDLSKTFERDDGFVVRDYAHAYATRTVCTSVSV